MKTFVISAFTLLLLTNVGFSQRAPGENANTRVDKEDAADSRAAVERKKQKELDAHYKASLGVIKAPTNPSDPWGDVRPAKTPASGR
jgi:hypothetical protein